LTVSGVAATRGSPASISAATAIFIIPPVTKLTSAADPRETVAAFKVRLGEKDRHQDDNDDDHRESGFHQGYEISVALLVRGQIVPGRCRVFDIGMIGHRISPIGSIVADLA
jgi:hypothetical protein